MLSVLLLFFHLFMCPFFSLLLLGKILGSFLLIFLLTDSPLHRLKSMSVGSYGLEWIISFSTLSASFSPFLFHFFEVENCLVSPTRPHIPNHHRPMPSEAHKRKARKKRVMSSSYHTPYHFISQKPCVIIIIILIIVVKTQSQFGVRAAASAVVNTHKSYYSHSFIYSCNKYVLWYTIHIYL